MIKKLFLRFCAAISRKPKSEKKYDVAREHLKSVCEFHILSKGMNEAEKAELLKELGKAKNKSGVFMPLGYAETITGKTQNVSDKNDAMNHPILNLLHKQQGLKPCLDRTIIAVIEHNGKIYIGTNGISIQPLKCHRNGYTINQGYDKCTSICKQPHHAEEAAITDWLIDMDCYFPDDEVPYHNATIYVYGAKAMCERCKDLCERYKLQVAKVSTDLMGFLEHGKND